MAGRHFLSVAQTLIKEPAFALCQIELISYFSVDISGSSY